MEKKTFRELIHELCYVEFGQTALGMIIALLLRKKIGLGVKEWCYDYGMPERLVNSSSDWINPDQLMKAFKILEVDARINGHIEHAENIFIFVQYYMQHHDDCIDMILEEYTEYYIDDTLHVPAGMNKQRRNDLIGDLSGLSVYDPYGVIVLSGNIGGCASYCGHETNPKKWALGVLRLEYYGVDASQYTNIDVMKKWNPFQQKYDCIFVEVPASKEYYKQFVQENYGDPDNIYYAMYRDGINDLEKNGRLFLSVLHGQLLKEMRIVREQASTRLKSVTMLPVDKHELTEMNAVIVEFSSKAKDCSVEARGWGDFEFFINQGHQVAETVYTKYREEANAVQDMNPNVYLLADLYAEKYRFGEPIKLFNEVLLPTKHVYKGEVLGEGACFLYHEFPDSPFNAKLNIDNLPIMPVKRNMRKHIEPVFISDYFYGKQKWAYAYPSEQTPIYTEYTLFQSTWTVMEGVTFEYLSAYLAGEEYQAQLRALNMENAPLYELLNITYIPVPSIKKQNEYVNKSMADALSKMGLEHVAEAQKMQEKYMHNLRVQKHALGQEMLHIRSKVKRLFNAIDKYNLIESDALISPSTGGKYGDYKESISQHLKVATGMIETLSGEMKYGAVMDIKLDDFFTEWCQNNSAEGNYQWKVINHSVRDEMKNVTEQPAIKIPVKALKQILLNIADNAVRYAFTSIDRDDFTIQIELIQTERLVTVRIMNNGNPLNASISKMHLLEYGYGHHTGLGIWQIKKIVDEYGVAMRVIDNKEEQFTFGYELDFKDVSRELLLNSLNGKK